MLNKQQIDQFQRDSFLIVRAMYSTQEMRDISSWTDEVAASPEVAGSYMMYFEPSRQDGSRILSRIEDFCSFHPGFASLITGRRMQQAVSDLFGERAVLFKDKINYKLPGGDGLKEHQDVQAGWDDYASLHITAMIAIDETNAANGSVEMIPGMHKLGLLGNTWEPLTESATGDAEYIPVHCQPGDAVFFDSYAPHRSMPNTTDHTRRVLYITFNSASEGNHRAQYYADKRKNYPPDIERDPHRDYSFKV